MEKVADRPHTISIKLSIAALLISLASGFASVASWLEGRNTRQFNQAISAAEIQIVSIKTVVPIEGSLPERLKYNLKDPTMERDFEGVIRNVGRSAAENIRINYGFEFTGAKEPHELTKLSPDLLLDKVAQGQDAVVSFYLFPSETQSVAIRDGLGDVELVADITYTDNLAHLTKTERFCFDAFAGALIRTLPVLTPCAYPRR